MYKKSFIRYFLKVCVLLPVGFAATAVHAQTGPMEEAGPMEEVLVTARRVEETLQDAPLTINVFTGDELEDAGVTSSGDFIQLTPNVTLAESQTMGTAFLTVRGLSRVRNGELPVAVVVDDVLTVNARQFVSQIFDVQQVEVVKGPQGAIYGRNASNGAIVITTRPPTQESEGYMKISYGTEDELGLEGSYSAGLSDRAAFRVSARMLERDGYFTNITLDEEVDPFSDRTLRGRLHWEVNDLLTMDFKAQTSRHEGKGIGFHWPAGYTFGLGDAPLSELGLTEAQVNSEGANLVGVPYVANNEDRGYRDTANHSIKLDWDLDAVQIKWVTTFDRLEVSSVADRAPYNSILADGTQHSYVDVDGWSQELRFSSAASDRLFWQAGAYYLAWERTRTTVSGRDLGRGIKRVTTVPEFEDSSNPTGSLDDEGLPVLEPADFLSFVEDSYAWALFGSVDLNLTDELTLSLAARYDAETREQNVNRYNTAGRVYNMAGADGGNAPYKREACDPDETDQVADVNCGQYDTFADLLANTFLPVDKNEKDFSQFQPKLTLSYSLNDAINLYGSWGIGYRAGQFNYPGIEVLSATAKDAIDAEENNVLEGGMKAEWDRVRLNLAVFRSDVENTQYFPFDGAAFVQIFEDVDEAELKGYEIELMYQADDHWDFYAAWGYTDTEITKYAERPLTVGNKLPYNADGTLNLGARFQAPGPRASEFFFRVDYEMRGEQYWTPENENPRDDLSLINVRSGFRTDEWTVSLYVNNLTDEEYNSEVVTPLFLHPAPPRVWRMDFRYMF